MIAHCRGFLLLEFSGTGDYWSGRWDLCSDELTRGLSRVPGSQSTAFSRNLEICSKVTEAQWGKTAENKLEKDFCAMPSANVQGKVAQEWVSAALRSFRQRFSRKTINTSV